VTHERHRRGLIFGVDSGLADGAGLAGGGRIDDTAGEVALAVGNAHPFDAVPGGLSAGAIF
jgi:hypothetical protein